MSKHEHVRAHFAYSQPRREDVSGLDYDSIDRVNGELIENLVPNLDAEFYLCGPTGFTSGTEAGLVVMAVQANRIQAENFEPVA